MLKYIYFLLSALVRMQFTTWLRIQLSSIPQFQLSSLPRMHRRLTTTSRFANPWTEPVYFFEDVLDQLNYVLEDYFFCSPVFWCFCFLSVFFIEVRIAMYIRRDYLRFLSLGRGGRPSNVRGWLQNKFYQILLVNIIGVDVFSEAFNDPMAEPYNGFLYDMPTRPGPRPGIIGMDPMRQKTDGRPRAMAGIMDRFVAIGLQNPERLRYKASFLTGLPALTRNLPEAAPNGTPNSVTEWGGELAYVRHDGSTSICLHPWDANEVIQNGWGERSPLAVMSEVWIWRFLHHRILRTRTPLPYNMVMVYAPRNAEEEIVFNHILAASIWWAFSQPDQ